MGKKWTEYKGTCGIHQADQHTHCRSLKMRRARKGMRIFEEIVVENSPKLMRDMNINTEKIQWTPGNMKPNRPIHYYNQTL